MLRRTIRSYLLFLGFSVPCLFVADSPARATVAVVDSTSIAQFLERPADDLDARRDQAAQYRKQAAKERNGPLRRELLEEAVVLDPSGVANWLALAECQGVMGDDDEEEISLASARAALEFLRGQERRKAIGDYSLGMGWWHYRQGHWRDSLDWGERAVRFDAGLEGLLIVALNEAKSRTTISSMDEVLLPFLPTRNDWRRDGDIRWAATMFYYWHIAGFDISRLSDVLAARANTYSHGPLRWSEYGMYCAVNGGGPIAVEFYERAWQEHPCPGGGWLTRGERVIPALGKPIQPMPFWTNPENDYVMGSLLAYHGDLRDRMAAANDSGQRALLAERVVRYTSRTMERYPLYPWPALWRAEALLVLGEMDKAKLEIRFAEDKFKVQKLDDPAVNRVRARIQLVDKQFGAAAERLRRAVVDFPDDATCWADLGIAEAVYGDPTAARKAFDRAIALDPQLAAAWYNRGLLSLKTNDLQSAQADLEKALEIVPGNDKVRQDLVKVSQMGARQRVGD